MTRLARSVLGSAVWGTGGVAAAVVLVEVLAPLGATPLFLALTAAGAYAALMQVGARRGEVSEPNGLVDWAVGLAVQFFAVWGVLALAKPWSAHADAFLAATQFRAYAAVALGGAFVVSLLLRMLAQWRPDLPGHLLVQGVTFWVSPFFGFFSPAVFAAMSVSGFGGAPTGLAGLGVAAGMVATNLAGRFLADWFTGQQRSS